MTEMPVCDDCGKPIPFETETRFEYHLPDTIDLTHTAHGYPVAGQVDLCRDCIPQAAGGSSFRCDRCGESAEYIIRYTPISSGIPFVSCIPCSGWSVSD